ncbi:MAG: CrcB family protein [Synergistales bacterium]|nr:CrcB family protein [Synergistales bacterium]
MKTFLLPATAGGPGAILRYSLSSWIHHQTGNAFPWGIITVNVLGCLIFGLLWILAEERFLLSRSVSIIALTGFVGSFTTFSTMAFETITLFKTSSLCSALIYLGTGPFPGIMAAIARTGIANTI